jgi:IS1 family transposase
MAGNVINVKVVPKHKCWCMPIMPVSNYQSFHSGARKRRLWYSQYCQVVAISATTVLNRIKAIAAGITKPVITMGKKYEVDELKTFIKTKDNDYWIIYELDKENEQIADFKVGKRNKVNVKKVIDTLMHSGCKQIYTDGLNVYKLIISPKLHTVRRYGTLERAGVGFTIIARQLSAALLRLELARYQTHQCRKWGAGFVLNYAYLCN